MLVSELDYFLPERLIAQEPASRRDSSRLLVVDRETGSFFDSTFNKLPSYLQAGDILVLNNTRVFPARLIGHKKGSGAAGAAATGRRVEVFLVKKIEPLLWEALVKPGRSLGKGTALVFGGGELKAEIVEYREGGRRLIRFESEADLDQMIDRIGWTPLPPYIKRDRDARLDAERYQTVYARERGAIAAPTAGLHFTPALLEAVRAAGIELVEITLHVGYGTFQPVRAQRVEDHRVEPETYTITADAANRLNTALQEDRRIVAVGTTTTRALESVVRAAPIERQTLPPELAAPVDLPSAQTADPVAGARKIRAGTATTDLFIYPGFGFQVVRGMITNFHLPRSSLLMLVSAFAGKDLVLEAYRHAVDSEYRFYSYGDAMLIL